jgi:hypothetical protein
MLQKVAKRYTFLSVSCCVILLLLQVGCADQWLLHPSNQPIDAQGARRLMLHDSGRAIEVFVARSPGVKTGDEPVAYVLEFCGNSTRAESVASRSALVWGPRPVEIWVMNAPGFGKSDGPGQLRLIPPSGLATYDQLKKVAGDKPIFVTGQSLGTTVALYVAAHRPSVGIILQSPPPIQRIIMRDWGWWNLWIAGGITALEVPDELNCLTTGPTVKVPAIFILTGKDRLVLPMYQYEVMNAYGGPKHCVLRATADHNSPVIPADAVRLQQEMDWLWRVCTRGI